jgi:hypothetical protein
MKLDDEIFDNEDLNVWVLRGLALLVAVLFFAVIMLLAAGCMDTGTRVPATPTQGLSSPLAQQCTPHTIGQTKGWLVPAAMYPDYVRLLKKYAGRGAEPVTIDGVPYAHDPRDGWRFGQRTDWCDQQTMDRWMILTSLETWGKAS